MTNVLTRLVDELNAGRVRVVDLTLPLDSETPVIGLPPVFAASPCFSMEVISRYDERGPAWYWNTLRLGEHTGTHFDAPVHWATGKDLPDNRCDTIPARRFVGPACVIDVTEQVAADADFLLTAGHVLAWEAEHGRVPPGAWLMLRTDWSKRTDPAAFLSDRGRGDCGAAQDCGRQRKSTARGRAHPGLSRRQSRRPCRQSLTGTAHAASLPDMDSSHSGARSSPSRHAYVSS